MRSTACCGRDADAVLGEAHALPEHLAQRRGHRRQRHLRHALALGPVEMAADDDLGALADQLADRRATGARCRVRSVILPSRTGTLRSARSSTRLPATSRPSRVRKDMVISPSVMAPCSPSRLRESAVAGRGRRSVRWPGVPRRLSRDGRGEGRFTGCRTARPCRTSGWRSPTRCRTSPSPAPARRPPPRSASHRRCRTPGCG